MDTNDLTNLADDVILNVGEMVAGKGLKLFAAACCGSLAGHLLYDFVVVPLLRRVGDAFTSGSGEDVAVGDKSVEETAE